MSWEKTAIIRKRNSSRESRRHMIPDPAAINFQPLNRSHCRFAGWPVGGVGDPPANVLSECQISLPVPHCRPCRQRPCERVPAVAHVASLVEVTRICFQERRRVMVACQCGQFYCNRVGEVSAVALSIPFCALPISTEIILSLLNSRNGSGQWTMTGSTVAFHARVHSASKFTGPTALGTWVHRDWHDA